MWAHSGVVEATDMKRNVPLLAMAMCVGTVAAAYAHHSHPYFYDQCKTVTIEGRIERVEWKDPHTLVFVRVDEGTAYTVDWNPLSRLTRNGITGGAKDALVFGARVAVAGNPIRTAAQIREHVPGFTSDVSPRTIDPTSIRRGDGSWSWARRENPNSQPPDCKGK
jgi:hypothetical protein